MRGGFRAGGGRPKGSRPGDGKWVKLSAPEGKTVDEVLAGGQTAVEFLCWVYQNADIDVRMRIQAAVAVAPYLHSKIAESRIGKKEIEAKRAQAASSKWGDDLDLPH